MNYLNTHGGDDSLALNDDIPMENRLFYGGSPASAESLLKELKDYRLSKSARAKETVMKAVIETIRDLGIKAHGNDIDSIVKTIEELSQIHIRVIHLLMMLKLVDVCKKIAAAVNKGNENQFMVIVLVILLIQRVHQNMSVQALLTSFIHLAVVSILNTFL